MTTTTDEWADLREALARFAQAYYAVLASRAENHMGSKKHKAAEKEFEEAHAARYEAAMAHWTEEDGYIGEFKRVGPAIQRYYAATSLEAGTSKRKVK